MRFLIVLAIGEGPIAGIFCDYDAARGGIIGMVKPNRGFPRTFERNSF
jgi:hypothetical protein